MLKEDCDRNDSIARQARVRKMRTGDSGKAGVTYLESESADLIGQTGGCESKGR